MPIHDWTRVDAGTFHHFHHSWIEEIARALNRGLLPRDYYAMSEQITGNMGPDVLTLNLPVHGSLSAEPAPRGVALVDAPPKVRFRARTEIDIYASKAKTVVIRHRSGHKVIAMVELVSPGNTNGQTEFSAFVQKADQALLAGIHLSIVQLVPADFARPVRHPPRDLGRGPRRRLCAARRQTPDLCFVYRVPLHRGLPRAGRRRR